MKRTNLDYAAGLVRKAENDWKTASIGLDHGSPLDTICFHIQQTAEKLLKALLAWHNVDYPLTHDLGDLLDLALPQFSGLEKFRKSLPGYTEFAIAMRYDDALYPSRDETVEAFETVGRLRSIVHSLLPPETRP